MVPQVALESVAAEREVQVSLDFRVPLTKSIFKNILLQMSSILSIKPSDNV